MYEYLVRSPFKIPTPQGDRIMSKGEALRLSSLQASAAVQRGFLLEKNVSGLQDVSSTCENRARLLVEKLQLSPDIARTRSLGLGTSLQTRHESLKTFKPPTPEFLAEVAEFNRTKGKKPITKIKSKNGAGEWAGYNCNTGSGCEHGCLYCYAKNIALRFKRIANQGAWRLESLREVSTAKCKKYPSWIMYPTTHDITEKYLPAYCCHLYNLLKAGNNVLLVTKPHRACIEAICSEFSSFRDNMIFRFSIGGLDNEGLKVWEPGAPSLNERLWCLKYVFEQGFRTSISAEPMLVNCEEAERFYHSVEPLVTENIWFGKMNNVGGFKKHGDFELVRRATELSIAYKDKNILKFVDTMKGLPKMEWKDSIKKIIKKDARKKGMTGVDNG